MDLYVYTGNAPEIPPDGEGVVRPREVWQFAEEPTWGSWLKLELPEDDGESEQAGNDGEGA